MTDNPNTIESTGLDRHTSLTRKQYETIAIKVLNSQRYEDLLGLAAKRIVSSMAHPETS